MPAAEERGFSLLEIVIAFSILALALGILLNIFSKGVHTAVVADDYTAAVEIAESLLAAAGVEQPLQPGETSGREDDKFDWAVTVTPFQWTAGQAAPARDFAEEGTAASQQSIRLYKVRVIIGWDADRQLELVTLKMAVNNTAEATDASRF